MKLLKQTLRLAFRLASIAACAYVFFNTPELILIPPALTLIFLAVWAFSKDEV